MINSLPNIGDISTEIIDGLEIRLLRSGTSDGMPILLTSPWPESIYAFRDILPALADIGPLIAVDLPGYGRSTGRPDLMAPEAMAGFVTRLADYFGISRLHAVAPDVGTPTILFAAAAKPDLFESIVVGGGAVSTDLASGSLKDLTHSPRDYFATVEGGDVAVQFVTGSAAVTTPAAVLEDYRASSAGRRLDAAVDFVRAYPLELPRLQGLLSLIETPVLILAGRNDPIVPPDNGQLLKDHLPHSVYTLLEGGHLIWEDAADEYAAAIRGWVTGGYTQA